MRLLATKVGALALTVVAAPAFAFAVFTTLRAESFTPLETLRGVWEFERGLLTEFDLGFSYYYDAPVTRVLLEGLPADLTMLAGALAFGVVAGSLAGAVAAFRPRSWVARASQVLSAAALSLPVYWLGLVVLLAVDLPFVSSINDYESLPADPAAFVLALWVPIVLVGAPIAAGVFRMTAAAMREGLDEDFVRTARMKGVGSRRLALRHVFPLAAVPVAILAASQVNLVIMNIALLQASFNIPGSFRDLGEAVQTGDIGLLQGMIVESCALIAAANMAGDLLQARIDPRVRR